MKYFFTQFSSVAAPQAKEFVRDLSFDELIAVFNSSKESKVKNAVDLFSFFSFRKNYRENDNAKEVCAVVLDIDNKTAVTEIDDIQLGYNHIIYTTHSDTAERPRFRVIIPLDQAIDRSDYYHLVCGILDELGLPEGLDKGSFDISRCYYFPSHNERSPRFISIKDKEFLPAIDFIEEGKNCEYRVSQAYEGESVLKYEGRNDHLKAVCTAMLHKGQSLEDIVLRLLELDQNNSVPLFSDPRESQYKKGDAENNALKFVCNIRRTLTKAKSIPSFSESEPVVSDPGLKQEKNIHFATPKGLIDAIPGVAGEIIDWILEGSWRPQPALALGATLSLMSICKGNKFKTIDDTFCNLFIANIAPSCSGKDYPQQAIEQVLVDLYLGDYLGSQVASDTGLFNALGRNERDSMLFVWDEIGKSMESITHKNSASYERKILKEAMRLFTSVNRRAVKSKEYANPEVTKQKMYVLQNPFLSILGSTTPETFYGSVNYDSAKDGFLARWLILQSENPYPKPKTPIRNKLPKHLLDYLSLLMFDEGSSAPGLSLNERSKLPRVSRKFKVIPIAQDALNLLDEIGAEDQKSLLDAKNDGQRAIFGRRREISKRVALAICDKQISRHDILWSYELVSNIALGLYNLVEHKNRVIDTTRKGHLDRMLETIRNMGAEGITKTELKSCSGLSGSKFVEYKQDLIQQGLIVQTTAQSTGRGRPKTILVAT